MSWTSGLNKTTLLPQLKPWQRFDWRSCIQSQIYRDWGIYYTRRLLNQTALGALGRSVAVCKEPEPQPSSLSCLAPRLSAPARVRSCQDRASAVCAGDYKTLLKRGQCQRSLARPDLAFSDAQRAERAMALFQRDQPQSIQAAEIVAEKCDALYDMNAFEAALLALHNAERKFGGEHQQRRFQLIKQKTLAVFEDTVGESLAPFLQQNRRGVEEAVRHRQSLDARVPLPLWKELLERQECDVLSVLERQVVSPMPLERARRRENENNYNHTYMGHSAVDVALLRQLRNDQDLLDPHRLRTTPHLRQLGTERYGVVRRFMKMLHARNPLYNRQHMRRLGQQERERRREMHLFHVAYQTRRDCLRMLREVRARRREGDVEKLSDYVEHIMSSYIEQKTRRTLPWKWEFLNDVYNILALAHLDRCTVPSNVDFLEPRNRPLLYLLRPEKVRDMAVTFGGPNIYLEIDRNEKRYNRINQKLEQLEDRLRHSRFPIERAYLLFEIARCHFKEARFDKCMVISRKAFNEARSCNSLVWRFNSIFLVSQVHAVLNRFERLKESLAKASQLAMELKAPQLVAYIAICINVNDYDLAIRRMRQSDVHVRKSRRSPMGGLASRTSLVSATTLSGEST